MGSNWITAEIVGGQGVAVVGTTVVIIEKVETCWEEAGNTQSRRSHQSSIIGLVYGEYVVTVVSRSRRRLKRTDNWTNRHKREMCT